MLLELLDLFSNSVVVSWQGRAQLSPYERENPCCAWALGGARINFVLLVYITVLE